jgi:anthranilate phosphoribosyltransferase
MDVQQEKVSVMSISTEPPAFSAAPYLREIGRGRKGARGLNRAQAAELMGAILSGRVPEVALGGVLLALRMKGEDIEEIEGFLDALEGALQRAPARAPAWVVLPSYNGARSMPNLVPLLAMLLARSGVPVLIHGQESEPATVTRRRVTSAQIFALLGVPACAGMAAAGQMADRGLPAVVELSACAPALSRLVALRPVMGVRNVGHTLAKLICPVRGPRLLIASYTHPDFGRLQSELFRRTGMHAMSLRGTDGESVISARRAQPIEYWHDGVCQTVVTGEAVAAADAALPPTDAQSTASWTREVLEGRHAVPPAIAEMATAVAAAARACAASAAAGKASVSQED